MEKHQLTSCKDRSKKFCCRDVEFVSWKTELKNRVADYDVIANFS